MFVLSSILLIYKADDVKVIPNPRFPASKNENSTHDILQIYASD